MMAPSGLEETAHALRHTLATRLVGADLVARRRVLGHADVKTLPPLRPLRPRRPPRRARGARPLTRRYANGRSLTWRDQTTVIRLTIHTKSPLRRLFEQEHYATTDGVD